MAVFEASSRDVEFIAIADSRFVVGAAAPHPHELGLGMYSVHTTHEALRIGESCIARIGHALRQQGRL